MHPEIKQVSLHKLTIHPLHETIFGPPDPEEVRRFAADIKERGLQQPLDVTSDFQIIAGRKRYLASQQAGLDTVPVCVRSELTDPKDVERFLIADNFVRHDLGRLERARCAHRLFAMKQRTRLNNYDIRRLKSEVAADLKLSRREVDRLLRVLEAPMPVQQAYDDGKVTLNDAGKVVGLPKAVQQQIADEILAGSNAKAAVKTRLTSKPPTTKGATRAYERFLKEVRTALAALADNVDGISMMGATGEANLETLASLRDLIELLTAREHHGQEARRQGASALNKVLEKLARPGRSRRTG